MYWELLNILIFLAFVVCLILNAAFQFYPELPTDESLLWAILLFVTKRF